MAKTAEKPYLLGATHSYIAHMRKYAPLLGDAYGLPGLLRYTVSMRNYLAAEGKPLCNIQGTHATWKS